MYFVLIPRLEDLCQVCVKKKKKEKFEVGKNFWDGWSGARGSYRLI